jgi:hypothetical protein
MLSSYLCGSDDEDRSDTIGGEVGFMTWRSVELCLFTFGLTVGVIGGHA